ncbi:uncharacterized protein LOC113542605 [Pangasianodon hypophthalmus]|uniref:uncharacterized protein LOC113542605 n=1 Tax=Pangasianodon hypophthalmus TaxID=310915 RepID=UPI002308014C|nr:uncharacterized protein LOC113542605 [Pangasianodon hypophthalmus]
MTSLGTCACGVRDRLKGSSHQSNVHKNLRELHLKVLPPTELLHETRDFPVSVEVPPEQEPSKEQLFPLDYNKEYQWGQLKGSS